VVPFCSAIDILGYYFGPDGLSVAKKTIENFVARAIRLYEQEPGGGLRLPPAWIVRAPLGQVDGGGGDLGEGYRLQAGCDLGP